MPSNGADAAGRVIVVASGAYTGLAASAYIEASYRGLAGTGTGRRAKKKKKELPAIRNDGECVLSRKDSNPHRQIQNLKCYHYTTGQYIEREMGFTFPFRCAKI